ncbi:DNA photolyase [Coniella lustricola]|uniref:DNA photolyase n=1 Tax=Coniella lustricola TaxID=2025994 RepID=A0A2T2ZSW4_9PEZI|nr:DNA photolyase [Coniella lustricola]
MASKARVIYWFRTDLRLHDSPALQAALDLQPECLWPIFTWDPHYVYRVQGAANRWQFLLDCQNDLSASITALNPASRLFVLREAPQTLLPKLFSAWNVTHLVFERDTDAYARARDATILAAAARAGVTVVTRSGRTLWDPDALVRANAGKPTMTMSQLQAAGRKVGPIPPPLPAPTSLPDPGAMPLEHVEDTHHHHHPPETTAGPDLNARWREGQDAGYARLAGPQGDFAVETLAELGFAPAAATTPHRGGETVALQRLDTVMADVAYAATFRKPQTSPAAFAPASTTLLSPFLHFGALSPRLFYHRALEACSRFRGAPSAPPESLTGQLLFRDMYFAAQAALGAAMAQTVGNPQVRYVPWHLPSKVEYVGGASYTIDHPQAEEWFQRWAAGTTGFPWIDALMRQLRHDGWIHHLGRHSVACFLTRGGCYIHWERGADVFAELLLDHEPACNSGNWQWLSCTAFFSQYYRCYSPVAFAQKWDRDGAFVRKWVPELQRLDKKVIHEPWKASPAELRNAGVALVDFPGVGVDMAPGTYPVRMFDFDERRRICIAGLKKAYEVGLHGDHDKVLDGTALDLFADAGEREGEMEGQELGSNAATAAAAASRPGSSSSSTAKAKKRATGPMDRYAKKQKVR